MNTKTGPSATSDRGPIQPSPIQTLTNHFPGKGPSGITTSISRLWARGDSGPEGRCKLCPECRARNGVCLVVVDRHVPESEAAGFSLREHIAETGSRGHRLPAEFRGPDAGSKLVGLTIAAPGEDVYFDRERRVGYTRATDGKPIRLHGFGT